MRIKIFCILLIAKIGTQVHGSPYTLEDFRATVNRNKGQSVHTALCRLVRWEDAIPSVLGALSTIQPKLVDETLELFKKASAVDLGLATEEATAKAREESAGALAALTSEKQALQAMNEGLRREIDTLKATLGSRIAGLEVQIAEERKKTRAEQDRVEEVARDRATTGRTADEEKARLGEQIRELQERLKRTEAELDQYKEMFTDQLLFDGEGQVVRRIKEAKAQRKPSSLASDTASLSPRSTPAGSLMGTPLGGLTAPRGPSTTTGPLMGTPVGGGTTPRSSLLKTLKGKLSGLKPGSENTLQCQVSPVETPSKPFVSPIVPPRTVDGTDSLPTSLGSAPEGGSGGKGRRKPSLSVDTGEQTTGGVTEEDPGA